MSNTVPHSQNSPHSPHSSANTIDLNAVFDIRALLTVLWRSHKLILGCVLLSGILGWTYLSLQTPEYTAKAMIQLNASALPVIQSDTMVIGNIEDKAAIQSELDILKSPELTQRVIERLNLQTRAEFNPLLDRDVDTYTVSDERMDVTIIKAVMDGLYLRKDPLSYTVHINFTSIRPDRARAIANMYAQEYMNLQIENQERIHNQANYWLSKRVDDLRRHVIDSERAVQQFAQDNALLELRGMTLNTQQLSELNSQLVQARSAYAQSEAKLAQAKALVAVSGRSGVDSVPEVLQSVLIQKLQEQEAALQQKRSELSGRYGIKHPRMQTIDAEINDLQDKIDHETNKVIDGLENELAVAKARSQSLTTDIDAMREAMNISTQAQIQLGDLQREAEANRALYENFLARLKETQETKTLRQSSAQIIAKAQLPLSPSAPNKKAIMVMFVFCGGMIGGMLALVVAYFARGLKTPEDVEAALGLDVVGMVPELDGAGQDRPLGRLTQGGHGLYAEAIVKIMTAIDGGVDDSDASNGPAPKNEP